MKNEIYAAIALALHEYKGNNVHDKEPGIITIRRRILSGMVMLRL